MIMSRWSRSANLIQLGSQCLACRKYNIGSADPGLEHGIWHLSTVWKRGAKTTTSTALLRLTQGLLPSRSCKQTLTEGNSPMYPTVIQQALNNMRTFSYCLLLTRVGSFYEMYFDQAEEYSVVLNLKLAKKKTSVGDVSMMGFPFFQLDRYLKILVGDMHKYVAISEEFPNSALEKARSGGLLFDRKVARIITPGTLIDEKFMNPLENNFLVSISIVDDDAVDSQTNHSTRLGLAWADLSSGEHFTQCSTIEALPSALARIGPREVVVRSMALEPDSPLSSILEQGQYTVTSCDTSNATTDSLTFSMLEDNGTNQTLNDFTSYEIQADRMLLQYIQKNLVGVVPKLRFPIRCHAEDVLMIDKNTLKALEIKTTLKDARFEGSLLHAVKRTVTNSGYRLLSQRLSMAFLSTYHSMLTAIVFPSTSLEEINKRLDIVTELLNHPELQEMLVVSLRLTSDSGRLVQKFSIGRGDVDDLLGLARTIQLTGNIQTMLQEHLSQLGDACKALKILTQKIDLDQPSKLAAEIFDFIDEEKLSQQHQFEDDQAAAVVVRAMSVTNEAGEELLGVPKSLKLRATEHEKDRDSATGEIWIMRPSASSVLQLLHRKLDDLAKEKELLGLKLRTDSKASSLTLKWTPNTGHVVHMKGRDAMIPLGNFGAEKGIRAISSSRSTRSIIHPLWTVLGSRIDDARLRIRCEEKRLLTTLRNKVIENLVRLRRNASVLDELDVATGFARLAKDRNLVRPILDQGSEHHIVAGRHLTVEAGLTRTGRMFTANDCLVGKTISGPASLKFKAQAEDDNRSRILLITGPNMGGKSTYLRQNALISILAQTGSYVPASYARIGIVDAIFSRIGSADNLYQDESTFMVEMLETSHILRSATHRSFVIMDEVGRGTTPEDGIAVGYAALHHLYYMNKCRALFATHFHRLADMTSDWEDLSRFCTHVATDGDAFSYVYKLQTGVNRKSHALKVAKLAKLPEIAIQVAHDILKGLNTESP